MKFSGKSRWECLHTVLWFQTESGDSVKGVDLSKFTQSMSARARARCSGVDTLRSMPRDLGFGHKTLLLGK